MSGTDGLSVLDPQQAAVVGAPAGARILVEAAPGCGKTHVACARVARLLEQGENPARILLLSFTRTAVHELRNRIALHAPARAELVRQVEVRTLDSFAWRLTAGAMQIGDPGTHEASIASALSALQVAQRDRESELGQWIGKFRHVLVDEAQDLVAVRAALVIALLNGLPAESGWTVFFDPAQAIYGWSSDAEDGEAGSQFIDLMDSLAGAVEHLALTRVHRTSEPALLGLLGLARTAVLGGPSGEPLMRMRDLLQAQTAPPVSLLTELPGIVADRGDAAGRTLVLFRRRVGPLLALSELCRRGLPCHLRIGGMPQVAAPWIAVVANEIARNATAPGSVSEKTFLDAWQACCSDRWVSLGISGDAAWQLLRRIDPSSQRVDFRQVRWKLAIRNVPDEIFTREIGPGGVIVGTVHGSKGRESEHVIFEIPAEEGQNLDDRASDEEARVLYVAISRAVRHLNIIPGSASRYGYHEGRAWQAAGKGLKIEIGRSGDVDPVTPLQWADAGDVQARLVARGGVPCPVHVRTQPEEDWTRRLVLAKDETIGALSPACIESLGAFVSSRARRKFGAPLGIGHLTWLDTTTVALPIDDPRVARLPHPWRDTGLVLAPIVAGMGYFKRYWRDK